MQAWRLSKARYAGDLSGLGAARDGQRWNQPGQRAVYLGLTPEISAPLVLCTYALPEDPGLIARPELSAIPAGWNAILHAQASASFGGEWLSAIHQVALVDQVPFGLDRRLAGAALP